MSVEIVEVVNGVRPWHVECGDALAVLRTLPAGCVQCCVCSPPYYSLRDYGVEGQIGLEDTPAEFVGRLVEVFREVRRVLRDDGTLWLNIGDSYCNAGSRNNGTGLDGKRRGGMSDTDGTWEDAAGTYRDVRHALKESGIKHKDRMGIPHMLVFALRGDGWHWRDEIVWAKKTPMPESVTDRTTKAHEFVFLLTKRPSYFYDAEAIKTASREPGRTVRLGEKSLSRYSGGMTGNAGPEVASVTNPTSSNKRSVWSVDDERALFDWLAANAPDALARFADESRNRKDVWKVSFHPYSGAHFATFPPALVETCVKAGTSEHGCCADCGSPYRRVTSRQQLKRTRPRDYVKRTGEEGTGNSCANTVAGVSVETLGWEKTCRCEGGGEPIPCLVLDPFSGAATTVLVATRLGRRAVGIELNPAYAEMGRRRVREDNPLFNGGE